MCAGALVADPVEQGERSGPVDGTGAGLAPAGSVGDLDVPDAIQDKPTHDEDQVIAAAELALGL